jgi:AcrR family transcriptional regulator
MPKLSEKVIAEKRSVIATAAKELFIIQGFHATSMRDISRRADVSLGNQRLSDRHRRQAENDPRRD